MVLSLVSGYSLPLGVYYDTESVGRGRANALSAADRPACALSDGAQALSCDQFDRLAGQVRELLPHAFR